MTTPIDRPATAPANRTERFVILASVEQLIGVASLFWALAANRMFLDAALRGRSLAEPSTWGFAAALVLMLALLHYAVLALVVQRRTVKPILALLIVATALAMWFMQDYGVYLDPSMLRNALRTDPTEARELLTWRLLPHLAIFAGLPLALLWRVRVVRRPWRRTAAIRLGTTLLATAVFIATLLAVFQPFAALMRNHREMRYLATPANYLYSIAAVAAAQTRGVARPRQPIGLDARPGPGWAAQTRPLVVVVVVGETARAANWGLAGYSRETTPQLARLPLINYAEVTACGTNTEVSLPCMFAPVGRRDYDEARIRGSESLLHVLAHAGVAVHWRDNQSGCKGVCAGLPQDEAGSLSPAGLCSSGHCLDEALLVGLDERLAAAKGRQLLVLHPLGNHGPAYFRRYPEAFRHFKPDCRSDDLQQCSREEIVNAYDNALRYTDHLLASLVAKLQAAEGRVDSVLVYVSDHGESLGESKLWLHGLPYAIAPDVQKRVPMLMWLSAGMAAAGGLDTACLQRRALQPAAHDHLFHTLIGLMDVTTSLYEPQWDLAHGCRSSAAQPLERALTAADLRNTRALSPTLSRLREREQ